MNIVALNSSARKGGNTEKIIGLIEARLRERAELSGVPLNYDSVRLDKLSLGICRGCRICFDRGEEKCPLKDSLQDVCAKLRAADGVICASPVYVEDVNSVMKNFIDRMAWSCHRPAFPGKTALVVTTSGMGSTRHSRRTMTFALGAWGFHIAGAGTFSMGARMEETEAAEKFSKDAAGLADRLYSAIQEKKPLRPSLFSLVVFKVQQKCYRNDAKYKGTYDRAWWEQNSLLEPRVSFYIPHKAGRFKTLAARILSVPVYRMFT